MSTTPLSTAADASDYAVAAGPYRTDGELLEAWAIDREHDALSILVQRYAALVLSVCRRQCRDRHDADDAFQATFLALARNAGSVRRADRLGGWLHRVAHRVACRARARNRQAPGSLQDDPPDPQQPLDQVARRHQLRVLDEEIAALPQRYQTVVVLHLIEGYTLAQVARQTGATTGAVRGRLQRGKQQLRSRLRRRGIVPGAAVATLALWPTDGALAVAAGQRFLTEVQPAHGAGGDGSSDPSSLDSLLQNGTHTMTLYGICGGGVAAAALLLAMVMSDGDQQKADGGRGPSTLSLRGIDHPPLLAQFGGANGGSQPDDPFAQSGAARPGRRQGPGTSGQTDAARRGAAQGKPQADSGSRTTAPAAGDVFQDPFEAPSKAPFEDPFAAAGRPATQEAAEGRAAAQLPLATQIAQALNQPVRIDLPATPLSELPDRLTQRLGIPVLLDPRGVAMAEAEDEQVHLSSEELPLRTALRKLLRPLGLKAVVEDDGLLITADTVELARRGVGTDQWINVDADAAERIQAALDETTSKNFVEETLSNVVRILSEAHKLQIRIDTPALGEVALTGDVPVTLQAEDVSLRGFLQMMLADLELTYTIRGETLLITTPEEAEQHPLVRVYWLDATGASQFDPLIETIRSSVEPDYWLQSGTVTPLLLHDRAAVTVATTLPIHEQIERLMEVLRDNHLGPDPAFDRQRWELNAQTSLPAMDGRGRMDGRGMHDDGRGGGPAKPGGMF